MRHGAPRADDRGVATLTAKPPIRAPPREAAGIPPHVRRALVASAVGTSIEWYDFFLYGTAAALVFPDLFFPEASHTAGIIASFGTYAVGFAARPVGAALFGHYGDRIGRKTTLIVTLLLMGLASAAIGLTPTHAAIGLWGAVILTLLRICQGIGVGGEWGGSVLLAMEWGDLRRRGFFASWAQIGVPVGLLLANAAVLGVERNMSDRAWETWGWRLPFLFSLVLVLFGLWIRLAVLETPEFTRVSRSGHLEAPRHRGLPAQSARDPLDRPGQARGAGPVLRVHGLRTPVRA